MCVCVCVMPSSEESQGLRYPVSQCLLSCIAHHSSCRVKGSGGGVYHCTADSTASERDTHKCTHTYSEYHTQAESDM